MDNENEDTASLRYYEQDEVHRAGFNIQYDALVGDAKRLGFKTGLHPQTALETLKDFVQDIENQATIYRGQLACLEMFAKDITKAIVDGTARGDLPDEIDELLRQAGITIEQLPE